MLAGVDEVESDVEAGCGEEESGDELARCGGIDLDAAAADASVTADRERQRPRPFVVDVDAEVAQSADEPAHRAMQSGLMRGEMHVVRGEPGERGDESHDRSRLSAVDGHSAGELAGGHDEVGTELASRVDLLDSDADRAECIDHPARVVRVQRGHQAAGTIGDGGDDQLAVRQ